MKTVLYLDKNEINCDILGKKIIIKADKNFQISFSEESAKKLVKEFNHLLSLIEEIENLKNNKVPTEGYQPAPPKNTVHNKNRDEE